MLIVIFFRFGLAGGLFVTFAFLGSNSVGGSGMLSSILVFYYSIIVSGDGGGWGGGEIGREGMKEGCKADVK